MFCTLLGGEQPETDHTINQITMYQNSLSGAGDFKTGVIIQSSKRYINYRSPPSNLIKLVTTKLGDEYPASFHDHIINLFSRDGDNVMEIASGTKAGKCSFFLAKLSQAAPVIYSASLPEACN